MSSLVGIDTSLALTSVVRGTNLTVQAVATAWLGRAPDFYLRPTGYGGGAAVPVTAAEIAAAVLVAPLARFAGYFNDSPLSTLNPPVGTEAQGRADAAAARQQLTWIGFPATCPVMIDLEHWHVVTAAYIAGVAAVEPTAIVYGTQQTCALARAGGLRSWLSSWGPQQDYANAAAMSVPWGATMWQCSGDAFSGIADEDVTSAAVVASFWDGRPAAASGPSVASLEAVLARIASLAQSSWRLPS